MRDDPFIRLDHVQLAMPADKEDRAREFYVGMLGFQEVTKPRELAKRGGCWFSSGSYDEFIQRLSDLGVRVVPDEIPLDGKAHCYLADPFGNRLELIAESTDTTNRRNDIRLHEMFPLLLLRRPNFDQSLQQHYQVK